MVVLKNRLDKNNNNNDGTGSLECCPCSRIPEQLGKSYSSSPPAQLSTGFVIEASASPGDQAAPLTAAGGLIKMLLPLGCQVAGQKSARGRDGQRGGSRQFGGTSLTQWLHSWALGNRQTMLSSNPGPCPF